MKIFIAARWRWGGALQKLGLKRGERVATLMWNHYAHLEAYYAAPCAGGVLHTLAVATVDAMGLANRDCVCPVVPMFHVNAWGLPFTAVMMGAKLAFPGPHLDAASLLDLYQSEQVTLTAGVPLPFFEIRAMGDKGEAPWDGASMGELQVRGPWVAAGYHGLEDETGEWTDYGWFCTGDIVTIDAAGYVKITDRIKDLVKSGGEWISSLDLENALVGHPKVREAAVIGVAHPKWDERPLAVVVLKEGQEATADELREYLAPKFAAFWLPDGFEFVDELPHTSTGKLLKAKLRERFRDRSWG